MRFLKNFLTPREQTALLVVCGLAILGLLAGQFKGAQSHGPGAKTELSTPELLTVATQEDQPVQIDIRTASKEELMLLPGIGEKRAQDIIAFRTNKPFTSTDDLLKIKGIGAKTLAKMLPSLLQFGSPQFSPEADIGSEAMTTIGLLPLGSNDAGATEQTKPRAREAKPKPLPKSQLTNIVNLNTAGLEELCTLPGIGEVKAKAVIDYRVQNGNFQSIEDITKVKGIGAKTLAKIRHRLSI
ncbi:MAG: helix-hairpin-helix domain-containing protein [Candidatus Cloacimonetes bacterium]|nr:helix-hairpin-helix domain-containing protein [Candidatus Cloacimonadota bacterium]